MLGQTIEILLDLLGLFDRPSAIVGLSVHAEHENADASAAGFARKGEPPGRLLNVIREVGGNSKKIVSGRFGNDGLRDFSEKLKDL